MIDRRCKSVRRIFVAVYTSYVVYTCALSMLYFENREEFSFSKRAIEILATFLHLQTQLEPSFILACLFHLHVFTSWVKSELRGTLHGLTFVWQPHLVRLLPAT